MNEDSNQTPIPSDTLKVLARNMYREANNYGFKIGDCVRFVNEFLAAALDDAAGRRRDDAS